MKLTMKQEIEQLNSKIDNLSGKFDRLISILSVGVKAELIQANNMQAFEVMELLKQTYAAKEQMRQMEIDRWIAEHTPKDMPSE